MKKQDIQMEGMVTFSAETKCVMFSPDLSIPLTVERFRRRGVGCQMTDGTFDFVPDRPRRTQSTLIFKTAHGRASKTADGAIQLTLKVFAHEGIDIAAALRREAHEAIYAVHNYQKSY